MYPIFLVHLELAKSKQVIIQDNQWEALLQNRDDPLALWQVINQTRTIQAMGNERLDCMTAYEAYNRLRQGFKSRWLCLKRDMTV